METEPTVADVLRDAAGVLRERGWCRWTVEDDEGHVCAFGALNVATAGMAMVRDYSPAQRAAVPVATFLGVRGNYDDALDKVVDWNNGTALDGEHVAQTFEKAAAAWEEVVW